jgi:hypothetical protein
MRFTAIDRNCQHCGKTFRVTKKSDAIKKYCSRDCYHAFERVHGSHNAVVTPITFNCKTCGTPFHKNPGELRAYRKAHGQDPLFCSRPCGWQDKRLTDDDLSVKCIQCGVLMPPQRDPGRKMNRNRLRRICSSECRKAFKLAELERLRPLDEREVSRTVARHGYIRLIFPRTRERDGFEILEHRWIMEQALGRKLLPSETIHHMNGRKTDNRLENLSLRSGNHGPGGDVSAIVKWAHEIIALYPQFDAEGNFTPVDGGPRAHQANPAS